MLLGEAIAVAAFYCRRSLHSHLVWLSILLFAAPHICSATQAAVPAQPTAEQLAAEVSIQRQFATNTYLADLRRAERVTYSVANAGAPYCTERRKYSLGIPPFVIESLPKDLRAGFVEGESNLISEPRFLNVALNSPAMKAGVRPGDTLLQMIDQATGKQVSPTWTLNRPSSTLVQNEPVALELQRGNQSVSLNVLPQQICDVQLQLLRTSNLVIRVEAGKVSLSQGLLRFVANDDELAYLIANELMHDQRHAARALKMTTANSKHHPPATSTEEREADYLGGYVVAAAEFDIARAMLVWRRVASAPPDQGKDSLVARHPLPPSRGASLQAVSAEIRQKVQIGARLLPDRHLAFSGGDFRTNTSSMESDKESSRVSAEDPRLRVLTNIPFIDNEGIAGYQRFLDSPLRPRAFAIGPSKTSWHGAWSFRFGTNAAADALSHCATFARGPCYLYAVNDKVVWNPETAFEQPQTNSNRTKGSQTAQPKGSGFAGIGDLTAIPLSAAELPKYKAFLEKPSPRAFVITQGGLGFYWIGPAAMHDALAHCARLDTPCWLYAVNDEVVWNKDIAKRISRVNQLPAQNAESDFLEN
ncbi:hypothetical protein VVD49_10215 [Uliginosibacterium sp. H3]|uniref:PDZ domain-containing protein n=1 Tax=Uliginosibacterium silvisoli TaxID=3114758 RepID=A0ABU6K344_9RHOO|nr:hypothetical protein [Uliginosibacterium sp. H3]